MKLTIVSTSNCNSQWRLWSLNLFRHPVALMLWCFLLMHNLSRTSAATNRILSPVALVRHWSFFHTNGRACLYGCVVLGDTMYSATKTLLVNLSLIRDYFSSSPTPTTSWRLPPSPANFPTFRCSLRRRRCGGTSSTPRTPYSWRSRRSWKGRASTGD